MEQSVHYRVGVDIGGTFTDIVLLGNDGSIATRKVSSTPEDYGIGIVVGLSELLAELALSPSAIAEVVHGTTVATNAILEGKGARTALITTEGFRDVLELRRIRIPELYNLFYEKPKPLVPRRFRYEVTERMGPRGDIRIPLDEATVRAACERIRATGAAAVAVCLLHSYANPDHELRIGQIARELLPDAFISLSVDILPELREYERTSTTVINSYVGPIVKSYLNSLLRQLHSIEVAAPLLIMQSNGGVMTAASAMERPAHIVESGPAAGVIASAWLAKLAGHENVITLDMGGTTAKASIIENGELVKTSEYEVGGGINLSSLLVKGGGYALKLPLIDVSEIGAGGGSIVWIDRAGMLQVGPQSAGATPGPVCYDIGGEEPTITDANVVLGYINPEYLAGGRVRLNAEKGRQALAEKIAARLDRPLLETAYGAYTLAAANMIRAVKAVSTYRGRDPRDFVLLGFGGNGPVYAAEMARSLRMKRVLVPPAPGLFSAFGLLFSSIEHEFVQTYFRRAGEIDAAALNAAYGRMEAQAQAVLAEEGYGPDRVVIRRLADLRYSGQAYELTVPVPGGDLSPAEVAGMVEAFGQEHLRTYGHRATDEPVDLVNLKVIGLAVGSGSRKYDPAAAVRAGDGARIGGARERDAYFGSGHGMLRTPIVSRRDLVGQTLDGPLIVEEYDATCVVPPGCRASVDGWGNIVVDVDVE
ncbi:MAG: hydantoinase/oxoprolinase family protein [Chloroflexi bacterium]|nr:hydantoinase/oxoprolinase family protein [Chloroflexota bacterium]